jgi:Autographiviridae endonuclease
MPKISVETDLKEKFSNSYKVVGECWIWQKCHNAPKGDKRGYGLSSFEGKSILAHRLSWILHRGPIPEGMGVSHDCPDFNKSCVNPDHLWLGTRSENAKFAVRNGRMKPVWGRTKTQAEIDKIQRNRSIPDQKGEKHPHPILTNEDVLKIRLLLKRGATYREIAESFPIKSKSVPDIKFRRTWKHI